MSEQLMSGDRGGDGTASRWDIGTLAASAIGILWIVLAAFWAVPGVFSVDGLTYQSMIDAFARNGSFFVENGYGYYPSPSLTLENMVVSGDRLAPQYPGGWGAVAAPAYLAMGLRGAILMNAVASALTIALVWYAARALFSDRRIAGAAAAIYALATFAVDYALGVWPHGVSACLVTAGFTAAATGVRGPAGRELRGLFIGGLAIGLAINIRVDAILAVAAIGAWTVGTARRPYAGSAVLLLGLLPGVMIASAINYIKFGNPSPLTYGRSEGGTNLGHYGSFVPVLAVIGLAVLSLGIGRVRAAIYRPPVLASVLAAGMAVVLIIPSLRDLFLRAVQGGYILVVDFQAHPFPGRGLSLTEDGTIRAYGLTKKALLQSLPYAAAAIVLLPRLFRGPDRAALALCALMILAFVAPFAPTAWHGGTANNMRYFLHFVPVLSIVAAVALYQILDAPGYRPAIAAIAEVALLAAVFAYVAWRGFALGFAIENTLPTALVLGISVLSAAFLILPAAARAIVASALRGLVVVGLVTAVVSAWLFDLQINQNERRVSAEIAGLADSLEPNALVVTFITGRAGFRLNRPPAMTSKADFETQTFDAGLVALVFADGRPVYAQSRRLAEAMIEAGAASRAMAVFGIDDNNDFYRMAPPDGGEQ